MSAQRAVRTGASPSAVGGQPEHHRPPAHPSFDVFDTVLTRCTGRPDAVAEMVAERLEATGRLPAPTAAFTGARKRAEPRLHTMSGRPPSLRAIYRDVAHVLSLPLADADHFAATEEAVERELSVLVPGAAALVAAGRRTSPSGHVVFVSDTPHSTDLLRELLTRQGLCEPGDHVFSSADMGASKSRGGLFTAVAATLGIPAGDLVHTGDNAHADVAAARAEGWHAVHRPRASLNRYEKLLDRRPAETDGFGAWLAGASRLARLRARERGVEPAVADVAAGVVAPVLIGYSVWLAAQAIARDLSRLYFVSRDGEVLLEVARPILAVLAPQVECRYLYGSRQSWILASGALSEEVLSDWLAPKANSTLRTALRRAGLEVEEVYRATGAAWADPSKADQPLPRPTAQLVSRELRSEPLRSMVLRTAREDAEQALAYVRQEGFTDDVRSGLVDLGWRGHSARAFDRLVRRVGGPRVEHLFLGLKKGAGGVRQGPEPPSMSAWLFDRDLGRAPDARPLERPNVVLEMFCSGSEGRLLRYRRDGRTVVPVLAAQRNTHVLEWGLPQLREVVADVVEGCVGALHAGHLHVDLAEPCWDVLHAFWMRPTEVEARVWGTFPWEEESYPPVYPIAETLPTVAVVRRILRRRQGLPANSWRSGSARLQRQPWRTILMLSELRERQQPRLRRWRRRAQLTTGRLRG